MTRPLNIDRFAKRACDSLTAQQVDSLGLTGLNRLSATDLCRWSEGDLKKLNVKEFNVSFLTKMNPLALSYQEAHRWHVFEPIDVRGFPALRLQTDSEPTLRTCNIVVATGPSQGIRVDAMSQGPAVDWCGKAIAAAEYVIGNLQS